jgi:acylaminoacyl-peptidase
MRLTTTIALLLSVSAVSFNASAYTTASQQPSAAKPLQADDIFQLEFANDVQLSPDGKHIAYVRNSFDVMIDNTQRSLWLLDVASGQHTPLFADSFSYGNPSWSPDGSRLAFSSNRGGQNQIHVYWVATQTVAQVTKVPSSPSQFAWSPNGQQLAFSMTVEAEKSAFEKAIQKPKKPEKAQWAAPARVIERTYYQQDGAGILANAYRQIFVVPSEGGTARQLTHGNFNHGGGLAWHADSSAIIFSANRHPEWEYQPNESDLWQVTLATAQLSQITSAEGREWNPVVSPDGKTLAFLQRNNQPVPYQNSRLTLMNLADQNQRQLLSELDRSVEDPQWLSNDMLSIQYTEQGRNTLATVTRQGKLRNWVDDVGGVSVGRPYVSGMYSVAPATGLLAYTRGSAQRPADVAVVATTGKQAGEVRTLTALNEDILAQRQLAELHEIRYPSSFDQTEIHGWYLTPPNFDASKQYPLIIEIHGGPHLAYGPMFSAELQRYAAEGYVVFYNNYRGSTSYGEAFALLLDGFYSSERDHADHMSGIDALIAKGFVDANNLFIAGGSAGGIATTYAVGLTNRFNAAAATNPVINWISKTLTADSYIGQIGNQFPAMPWEDFAHYWQRSPLSLVGNVTTPTLLFSGENDRRVPMSEIEQFYQALKLRQVDTAMVRVPGASHNVTARPSQMISKIEHTLAWFMLYKKSP